MFTSRVEYRLILGEYNADLRLSKIGYSLGLVKKKEYLRAHKKEEALKKGLAFLKKTSLRPAAKINSDLALLNIPPLKRQTTLEELLRRPQIKIRDLEKIIRIKPALVELAYQQLENEVKYAGFIQRQLSEVERFKHLEKIRLPQDLDYAPISSLSREIKEKLKKLRPLNLGQASRISGVTPAAVSILMVYLRKLNGEREKLSQS